MRNSLSHVLICYGWLYRGIAIKLTVIYECLNMLNIAILKQTGGYLYMCVWSSLTCARGERIRCGVRPRHMGLGHLSPQPTESNWACSEDWIWQNPWTEANPKSNWIFCNRFTASGQFCAYSSHHPSPDQRHFLLSVSTFSIIPTQTSTHTQETLIHIPVDDIIRSQRRY